MPGVACGILETLEKKNSANLVQPFGHYSLHLYQYVYVSEENYHIDENYDVRRQLFVTTLNLFEVIISIYLTMYTVQSLYM